MTKIHIHYQYRKERTQTVDDIDLPKRSKRLTRRFLKSSPILILGHTRLIGVLYNGRCEFSYCALLSTSCSSKAVS